MLLNLIKYQRPDITKIYVYVKDLFQSKSQLLINGRQKVGIEILKNLTTFIDIHKQVMMFVKICKILMEEESVDSVLRCDSRCGM